MKIVDCLDYVGPDLIILNFLVFMGEAECRKTCVIMFRQSGNDCLNNNHKCSMCECKRHKKLYIFSGYYPIHLSTVVVVLV